MSVLDVATCSPKLAPKTKNATIFLLTFVPLPTLVLIPVNFQRISVISEHAWHINKDVKDFQKKLIKIYNRLGH